MTTQGRSVALNLKYNILDNTARAMCTHLAAWKNDFYLAGGTGLALQIGHRISEDFDLFTNRRFDNSQLLRRVQWIADISFDDGYNDLQIIAKDILQKKANSLTGSR